jgi:uncharacterized membrane protein YidH (DUF202 family)
MNGPDPGLQPQRTALAWNRTALAMAVNALLVIRGGMQDSDTSLLGLGILVALMAGALVLAGALRRRQLDASHAPRAADGWLMLMTATAVGLAACSGVWVMLH